MSPNPAKLMDSAEGPDGRIILNLDVTRQRRTIGHDDVIAQSAVVSDVNVCHQQIVAANASHASALGRPSVECNEFPDGVLVADDKTSGFTAVFNVLRRQAEGGIWKDTVCAPNLCDPFDHHMGHYFAVVADLDALSED